MPIRPCTKDGKPGYKWGSEGACYVYIPGNKESRDRAWAKADTQRKAIEAERHRND